MDVKKFLDREEFSVELKDSIDEGSTVERVDIFGNTYTRCEKRSIARFDLISWEDVGYLVYLAAKQGGSADIIIRTEYPIEILGD